MNRVALVLPLAFVVTAACGAEDPTDVGVAVIAITQAPTDVGCIRINAQGSSRTVVRLFDVAPAQSTVFTLDGLPLGNVTFSGDAFAVQCPAVDSAAVPTWVSSPVVSNVVAGTPSNVTLIMRRGGRGMVSVDFEDDPPETCAVDADCAAPSCAADGSLLRALCTNGRCIDIKTSCGDFACQNGACPNSCTSNAQCAAPTCAGGNRLTRSCTNGDCIGVLSSCSPFACFEGACRTSCSTSADCAPPVCSGTNVVRGICGNNGQCIQLAENCSAGCQNGSCL